MLKPGPDNPEMYKQEIGSNNCMQCAVAYLLRLPLDQVPHFAESGIAEECWDMFDDFFLARGEMIVMYPANKTSDTEYLVSGKSPRGVGHMVVMKEGRLLFDPHPSNQGLSKIQCTWMLADKVKN